MGHEPRLALPFTGHSGPAARTAQRELTVSSGPCYEIVGHDKAGNKVEIDLDPATGAELQRKS